MKNKTGRKLTLCRSQRGDTFISVAMSVAAISLVIVLSYFLVSRGIRLNQQAKEREQVRNLVQSQIEGIKNLAFKGGTEATQNPFYTYEKAGDTTAGERRFFCLNPNGLIVTYKFVSTNPSEIERANDELVFYTSGSKYTKMTDLAGMQVHLHPAEIGCEAFPILEVANVEIVITYEKYKNLSTLPSCNISSSDCIEQNLFTVTATWDGASGGSIKENMVVATRLHPLSTNNP